MIFLEFDPKFYTTFKNYENYFIFTKRLINDFDLPVNRSFANYDSYENYFYENKVPKRIKVLVKTPKIVLFLIEPKLNAYLCFQENRIQSNRENFDDFIQNESSFLKQECLNRGVYADHLKIWLKEFRINSFLIIDLEEFIEQTTNRLNKLQTFLQLNQQFDYSISNFPLNILNISESTSQFLDEYYIKSNNKLKTLLIKNNLESIPKWLYKIK